MPEVTTTGWGERLARGYVVLLAVAVGGSVVAAAVVHLAGAGGCTAPAPCLSDGQRPALAVALAVLLLGLLAAAARALGPVGVTPAEATWLLSTPAARGRLLLPALVRALLVAAAVGALAGTAVGLLAVGPAVVATAPAAAAPAALVGAALSVLVVSGLVLLQVRDTAAPASRVAARAVTAAGAVGCAAVVLLPDVLRPDVLVPGAASAALLLALPAGLLAAAAAGWAALALDRVPVRSLLAGATTRRAVSGAVLRLDTDVLGSSGTGPGRRRARLRLPRRGGVWTALVVVGALAVTSRPERVLDAVVLLVLPLVVAATLGTPAGLAAATAVATLVLTRAAAPVRTVTRSASLARSLPVDLRWARAGLLVAPGLAVLAWTVPAALATGAPVWTALVLGSAALAGCVRAASPAAGDAGALLMTEAGPVALGTATDPLRGADAAAVAVLPLLLGAPPWLALAVPVLVLGSLLRHGPR